MKTALLGCLCALVSVTAIEVWRVGEALKGSIELMPTIVDVGTNNARADIVGAVAAAGADITAKLDSQATGLRSDVRLAGARLDGHAEGLRVLVNDHLTVVERTALARIGEAVGALETSAAAVQDLSLRAGPVLNNASATLEQAAKITAQVNEAAPLFLDCDHNPSCLYSRVQGTTKAIESVAKSVEREAAPTAQSIRSLTESAAEYAARNKRRNLWGMLFGR